MKPIILDNVSKSYRRRGRRPTLAEIAGKGIRALKGQKALDNTRIDALKDISFKVEKGEILGIIGPNGAGKTTILSLIAGVTRPTKGKIDIQGRIAPLIALGAGFHPELTGRENIYLNSIIMGMTKKEVQNRFDAIVDFAEIGNFLNTPVKRYSSGMHARLGFATAIHIDPDILLVDEVLAVGDFAFQKKCLERMKKFKQSGVSIVFVSHNLDMVSSLCPNTLLLSKGRIVEKGPTADVINKYYKLCKEDMEKDELMADQTLFSKGSKILKTELFDISGKKRLSFKSGEKAVLQVKVLFQEDLNNVVFGFFITRPDGYLINSSPSNELGVPPTNFQKGEEIEVKIIFTINLLSGIYHVGAQITKADFTEFYDFIQRAVSIKVTDEFSHGGVANLNISYEITRN